MSGLHTRLDRIETQLAPQEPRRVFRWAEQPEDVLGIVAAAKVDASEPIEVVILHWNTGAWGAVA
jgi:hypothetical protein